MLVCIETHRTCDFPGGPDPLSPPLDPHLDVPTPLKWKNVGSTQSKEIIL